MSKETIMILRDDETGALTVTVTGDGLAQDIANDIMLTVGREQGDNFTGVEESWVH